MSRRRTSREKRLYTAEEIQNLNLPSLPSTGLAIVKAESQSRNGAPSVQLFDESDLRFENKLFVLKGSTWAKFTTKRNWHQSREVRSDIITKSQQLLAEN